MESIKDIIQSLKSFPIDLQKIYPRSFCSMNGLDYGLIRTSDGKKERANRKGRRGRKFNLKK